jgi:hypothetical protein
MKIKLLAVLAALAIPAAAFAQEMTPEEECCCCNKAEHEGGSCCPESTSGEDHAGHAGHGEHEN